MNLTIRKNGKYYQAGYYEKSKWINIKQLGTAEKVVCVFQEYDKLTNYLLEHTKTLSSNTGEKQAKHTNK